MTGLLLFAGLVATILAMFILGSLPASAYPRRRRRRQPQVQWARPSATPAWPAGGSRSRVTPEYRDYIRGRIPGKNGRTYWPELIRPWKAEFRLRRDRCEIGTVLRQLGYPNCGPRPVDGPIHADHTDDGYRRLFCEQREDVALGCPSCHDMREALKRRGIYIYQEAARA